MHSGERLGIPLDDVELPANFKKLYWRFPRECSSTLRLSKMKRRTTATSSRTRKKVPSAGVSESDRCDASITALDALPARIAVVNGEGKVLLVNRAWREYASGARNESDRSDVGDNYLDRCRQGSATAPYLSEFADGVEAVLTDKRPEFTLEYPSDLRGTENWFHARVTRCTPKAAARAVIAHEDISESVRLEREIVAVSAHEQQRLRQDLHDGLSQQLTGLKFKASLLELHLQSKNIAEAAEAKALSELLNEATDEASNLARRMRPVEVEARGLMMALRELALTTEHKHEITCQVNIRRPVFIHDNNTATNLFRIASEAVESAVSIGGARRVQIALNDDGQRVTLTVRDNGTTLSERVTTGFHAHMMRYHARMIGGALEWRREAPKGVTLVCCFHKKTGRAD